MLLFCYIFFIDITLRHDDVKEERLDLRSLKETRVNMAVTTTDLQLPLIALPSSRSHRAASPHTSATALLRI